MKGTSLPSDVDWLGDIPNHWDMRRLKYIVEFRGGGTPSKDEERFWDGDIPWVSPKDMRASLIVDSEDHITEEAVRASSTRQVPTGSVLVVVRSGILRHSIPVAIAGRPVTLNQDMKALIPRVGVESRYLRYVILGRQHALLLAWRKAGATVESIEHDLLANTVFPVPPYGEQQLIADFLDEKTAAIDALIAKKERLIFLIEEKRQAAITRAVTKGLDPDVPMKDSGVEWFGKVPNHWQIFRLKQLAREPFQYGANEAGLSDDPTSPRFIRITDLRADGGLRDDTFKSLPEDVARPYLLRHGDILFARSGATVGKAVRYRAEWGRACFAGYLIRYRPNERMVSSAFIEYYTQCAPYREEVGASTIQATIQNVSAQKFGEFRIAVPPLDEQLAVVAELDLITQQTRDVVRSLEIHIEKLREYRQAIISAAVTGQIDVRSRSTHADRVLEEALA